MFEAEVEGYPTPTIDWLCDGNSVAESRSMRTYFDGRMATLKIYDVTVENQGVYTMRATVRRGGTVETTARLIVEGNCGLNGAPLLLSSHHY